MDDGVAYMVMGADEEMSQATQMVALDNGDGTQQFAIPVMDPETGQETYMLIDPQTAQVKYKFFCKTRQEFHDDGIFVVPEFCQWEWKPAVYGGRSGDWSC